MWVLLQGDRARWQNGAGGGWRDIDKIREKQAQKENGGPFPILKAKTKYIY